MEIREARASDAAHLARFINMAADDLPLHFWRKTVGPDGDPWALGQERAARERRRMSTSRARLPATIVIATAGGRGRIKPAMRSAPLIDWGYRLSPRL